MKVNDSPTDADLLLRCLAWQTLSPRHAYERTRAAGASTVRLHVTRVARSVNPPAGYGSLKPPACRDRLGVRPQP